MVPSRGATELHTQMKRRCPQGGADRARPWGRDPADLTPSGPGRWGYQPWPSLPWSPRPWPPWPRGTAGPGAAEAGLWVAAPDPSVPRLSCTSALLEFPGHPGGSPLTTWGWQHRPAKPAATSRTPCSPSDLHKLLVCGQAGPRKPGVDEAWAQGPVASQMSGHINGSLVPREREAQRPRRAPEGAGG